MSTISKRIHKVFVFLDPIQYRIGTNPFVPGRNWNEKEHFYLLLEKLERKEMFLFTPRTKLDRRNVYIYSRMKMEQKEHFFLLQAKVEGKRINLSV
jgi:hypothetical protein